LLARLDLVRRRWDLAIIASLRDGGVRPAGLMRVINAQAGERRLTWKVLAERLDWLESEGYVTRRQVDPGEHGTGCGPGHAGHWRHSTRWLHGTTSLKARHMAHEGPTLCAGDIDGREIQLQNRPGPCDGLRLPSLAVAYTGYQPVLRPLWSRHRM
jgi:hypothetical protein